MRVIDNGINMFQWVYRDASGCAAHLPPRQQLDVHHHRRRHPGGGGARPGGAHRPGETAHPPGRRPCLNTGARRPKNEASTPDLDETRVGPRRPPAAASGKRPREGAGNEASRAGDPPAGAPAPRLRAPGLGEPERHVAVPLRQGRRGAEPGLVEGRGGLPAGHHGAVPLGLRALGASRTKRRSAGTPARSRSPRAGRGSASSWSSAPPTGTPPPGSTARSSASTRAATRRSSSSSRAHARPGSQAAADPPRRRRGARVQARGQAGLRQRARHLADAVPRGARRRRRSRPCTSPRTSTRRKATVEATLLEPAPQDLTLRLAFKTGGVAAVERRIAAGRSPREVRRGDSRRAPLVAGGSVPLRGRGALGGRGAGEDVVSTYFGMRKISVVNLPGTDHPYVALNGEPVYLQLALDQAYHPDGFYTFPSDEFVRDEVLRARQIGLNGLREHVKIETPRKLYWADRLGVLIMADVPNSWGEPTAEMRQEAEETLRGMIQRDYNHPSIFSWIPFNETWGLFHEPPEGGGREGAEEGLPARDAEMGGLGLPAGEVARRDAAGRGQLGLLRARPHRDRPQLVARLPARLGLGRGARQGHDRAPSPARPGTSRRATSRPASPTSTASSATCGATRARRATWTGAGTITARSTRSAAIPKLAGWLYTEHHDVINEWNGYWRFDRSEKFTGLEDLVPGMTLRDLHAPFYVAVGTPADLSRAVKAGETVEVPLWASFLTGRTRREATRSCCSGGFRPGTRWAERRRRPWRGARAPIVPGCPRRSRRSRWRCRRSRGWPSWPSS